jgi:hypothetical protein
MGLETGREVKETGNRRGLIGMTGGVGAEEDASLGSTLQRQSRTQISPSWERDL